MTGENTRSIREWQNWEHETIKEPNNLPLARMPPITFTRLRDSMVGDAIESADTMELLHEYVDDAAEKRLQAALAAQQRGDPDPDDTEEERNWRQLRELERMLVRYLRQQMRATRRWGYLRG